jgi:hypothetical protein
MHTLRQVTPVTTGDLHRELKKLIGHSSSSYHSRRNPITLSTVEAMFVSMDDRMISLFLVEAEG